MKDTIVCKDSRHLGKSLEILDSIDLRCSQPKFAITDGARGPVISWNGTFDREEPPFSKYMLYYSKVMNIGKFHLRIVSNLLRHYSTNIFKTET